MRIVKKNYSVKDIRKIFLELKEDIEVLSEIDKVILNDLIYHSEILLSTLEPNTELYERTNNIINSLKSSRDENI